MESRMDKTNQNVFKAYKNLVYLKVLPEQVMNGTGFYDWWMNHDGKSLVMDNKFYRSHLSDIFRFSLLTKYGGVYSDLDTINLKGFKPLLKTSGCIGFDHKSLNSAISVFSKRHPVVEAAIEEAIANYDPNFWSSLIHVLKNALVKVCNTSDPYKDLFLDIKVNNFNI